MRGRAHEIGQAGKILLTLQHQRVGLFVGEHVLAEACAEAGEPLGDLGEPLLGGWVEARARAPVHQVVAVEHARLLRREPEPVALLVQGIDPPEQAFIVQDPVMVGGQLRPDLALDGLQRLVGVGAGEVEEHAGDAVEKLAAAFQRGDGIVEGRRVGLPRCSRDLGIVLGKAALERRQEMLRRDAAERRNFERAGPGLEEGIVAGGGGRRILLGHACYMVAQAYARQAKVW